MSELLLGVDIGTSSSKGVLGASLRLAPVDVWLLGRLRVQVPGEPIIKLGSPHRGVPQSPKQLSDAASDQSVGVPRSGRSEYVAASRQLLLAEGSTFTNTAISGIPRADTDSTKRTAEAHEGFGFLTTI